MPILYEVFLQNPQVSIMDLLLYLEARKLRWQVNFSIHLGGKEKERALLCTHFFWLLFIPFCIAVLILK